MWYLLSKRMQLGIPITIISGGIKPVSAVILYPKSTIVPNEQITPTITISNENITGVVLRKNAISIKAVTKMARPKNMVISPAILRAITVRI
jgi:hypothetical protein